MRDCSVWSDSRECERMNGMLGVRDGSVWSGRRECNSVDVRNRRSRRGVVEVLEGVAKMNGREMDTRNAKETVHLYTNGTGGCTAIYKQMQQVDALLETVHLCTNGTGGCTAGNSPFMYKWNRWMHCWKSLSNP